MNATRIPAGQPLATITDKSKLKLPVGFHQDGKEKGLRLRVNEGGQRSWVAYFAVAGQGRSVKKNIGDALDMPVEVARRRVEDLRVAERGTAPKEVAASEGLTFKAVVEDYDKPLTTSRAKLYFGEWDEVALSDITEEMVHQRVRRILAKARAEAQHRDACAGRESRSDAGMTAVDAAGKLLRGLYKHAIERMKYTGPNLGKLISKHEREPRRVWLQNDEDYDRVVDVLDNWQEHGLQSWCRNFFKIILMTTTRKGVLLRARWADIDLKRGLWTVPANQSKNGEVNFIHLNATAVALFTAQKAAAGDSPFVFPSPQYDPMHFHLADATPGWVKVREAAKVNVTIHDLRRTAISRMVTAGAPMKAVSVAAGHKNVAITEKVYGHLAPKAVRDALSLLE
jgi:integrase